jgi:signal transduction histidine kinase
MARLRGVVEEMKTEERSVDRSREREERLRSSFLQGLLLVATVALGALGAGLWFRRRSSLRMEKAHAERQQLVDQLKRLAQENLETVRFAERFVGVLGHDLRNPLSAIRMTSDRARRALGGRVDTRFLERIAAATDRANGMVEQLLDLTRSRLAGGIPLDPRAGNLAEVVLAVVDELRATYPNQTVACDVTAEVIGRWDLDRVAQILSNLVGNALKHGDPAEPVTVTLRADDKAVLEVHNRGRPIPAAELPHLFEPYYRGSSDAPRSGLGLGLFIANQIAIAHGGSIEVTSSESNGTAFTLFLPLSDEASLAAADISGLRSGRGVGERRASPR